MSLFLKRFIIFLFPFVVFLGLTEYILLDFGETLSAESVHTIQEQDHDKLYQRGILSQQFNIYKLAGIRKYKPDILIVGSSRVMKFRSEHFDGNYSFYNGGGMLQTGEDCLEFADMITSDTSLHPDVLLIGIDPWWFIDSRSRKTSWLVESKMKDESNDFMGHLKKSKEILLKRYVKKNFNDNNIGYYAQRFERGFRYDGSLKIAGKRRTELSTRKQYMDERKVPYAKRIREGTSDQFVRAGFDSELFNAISDRMDHLRSQGIELIIYLPPFSDEIYEYLSTRLDKYRYVKTYYNKFESYAEDNNIQIIAHRSPSHINLDDTYFIDGLHPGEVFLREQLSKVEWNDKVNTFIDLDQISKYGKSPSNLFLNI